jgi:hypothetical protein
VPYPHPTPMRSDRGGVGRLREPASRGITATSAPPQAAGSRLRSLLILMAVARTEPASLDSQRRLAIAGQKARKSCALVRVNLCERASCRLSQRSNRAAHAASCISWLTKPFESRNARHRRVDSCFAFLHHEQTKNILRRGSGRVVPKQCSSRRGSIHLRLATAKRSGRC